MTLKAAATLDGKIATASGESQWITGPEARQWGHRLRAEHEAILVGIGTVLADDPALTTRGVPEGPSPARVVLDSQGRLPAHARVLAPDSVPVWVFTGAHAPPTPPVSRSPLHWRPASTFRPEIPWVLEQLEQGGIQSLLVEGGAQVHAAFLKAEISHELKLFLAPKVIGGQNALTWCADWGAQGLADTERWKIQRVQMLGKDLLIEAEYLNSQISQ